MISLRNRSKMHKLIVNEKISFREAIEFMDKGGFGAIFFIDDFQVLVGVMTDGDVRRAILRAVSMEAPASTVFNKEPKFLSKGFDQRALLDISRKAYNKPVPVINEEGAIVDIVVSDIAPEMEKDNPVVIMAGGLGTRLLPLTKEIPKPMIHVGQKPILQTIVEQFRDMGYKKFYFCVNYKAELIEAHFLDGSPYNVNIQYIREEKRLGTAGALSMIVDEINCPVFVMNADLLTKLNFDSMLEFHNETQAEITIATREYNYQIPYGVVEINKEYVTSLVEKPVYSAFVNSGIYVLSPEILALIPKNQYYDMTDLIDQVMGNGAVISSFPIREYWMDIGKHDDLARANIDYHQQFIE